MWNQGVGWCAVMDERGSALGVRAVYVVMMMLTNSILIKVIVEINWAVMFMNTMQQCVAM